MRLPEPVPIVRPAAEVIFVPIPVIFLDEHCISPTGFNVRLLEVVPIVRAAAEVIFVPTPKILLDEQSISPTGFNMRLPEPVPIMRALFPVIFAPTLVIFLFEHCISFPEAGFRTICCPEVNVILLEVPVEVIVRALFPVIFAPTLVRLSVDKSMFEEAANNLRSPVAFLKVPPD